MQDALLFLMQQIVLLWIRCVVARVRLDFRYVVVRLRLDGCKIKFWKTYVVWNYYAPGCEWPCWYEACLFIVVLILDPRFSVCGVAEVDEVYGISCGLCCRCSYPVGVWCGGTSDLFVCVLRSWVRFVYKWCDGFRVVCVVSRFIICVRCTLQWSYYVEDADV